ncbi:hypothetical protein PtA15_6A599 [Puccinia triticina]|uniref:Inner centromere protein ARK-binding domain-containing protein n=1 Tax=Puccinia triticina TaxID=208348 RepID=A0ABY7CLE2_9BASI|nr:uncharacterized protein PtA15_6A599 [Puccinia triticina]WAQ85969.1 hypothetical protein PtA15_6A599 [Puccinia triticina]
MNAQIFNPNASHVTKADLIDFLYRSDPHVFLPTSITKDGLIALVQERLNLTRLTPPAGRGMRHRGNPPDPPAPVTVRATRRRSVPGNPTVVTSLPRAPRRSTPAVGTVVVNPIERDTANQRAPAESLMTSAAGPTVNDEGAVKNVVTPVAGTPVEVHTADDQASATSPARCPSVESSIPRPRTPTFAEVVQKPRNGLGPIASNSDTLQISNDVQLQAGSTLSKQTDVKGKNSEPLPPKAGASKIVAVKFAPDSTPAVINARGKKSKQLPPPKAGTSNVVLVNEFKLAVESTPAARLHVKVKKSKQAPPPKAGTPVAVPAEDFELTANSTPVARVDVVGKKSKHETDDERCVISCTPLATSSNRHDDKVTRAPEAEPGICPIRKLKTKRPPAVVTENNDSSDEEIKTIADDCPTIKVPRSATADPGPAPKLKTMRQSPDKDNQKSAQKPCPILTSHPLAIDPPRAGIKTVKFQVLPSAVKRTDVDRAISRLNVGRKWSVLDPVDPTVKPTISRLNVGGEWRYLEHGQAGIVSVANIPTNPKSAAAMGSPHYWDPKDDTRHNTFQPHHLLDSSPNLVAGLPEPISANPIPKSTTPDLLLDFTEGLTQWSLIDGSETLTKCNKLFIPLTPAAEQHDSVETHTECEVPGSFPSDPSISSNEIISYPPTKSSSEVMTASNHFSEFVQDALLKLRQIPNSIKPSFLQQPLDTPAELKASITKPVCSTSVVNNQSQPSSPRTLSKSSQQLLTPKSPISVYCELPDVASKSPSFKTESIIPGETITLKSEEVELTLSSMKEPEISDIKIDSDHAQLAPQVLPRLQLIPNPEPPLTFNSAIDVSLTDAIHEALEES